MTAPVAPDLKARAVALAQEIGLRPTSEQLKVWPSAIRRWCLQAGVQAKPLKVHVSSDGVTRPYQRAQKPPYISRPRPPTGGTAPLADAVEHCPPHWMVDAGNGLFRCRKCGAERYLDPWYFAREGNAPNV